MTLDELLEYYNAAAERQQRLAKVVAAAMGAEMEDDRPPPKNWSSDNVGQKMNREYSTPSDLPFNVGYEKIS